MRDSNVANAAKESTQGEFSHGLRDFRSCKTSTGRAHLQMMRWCQGLSDKPACRSDNRAVIINIALNPEHIDCESTAAQS
jgi:hypothetical protein